MHIHWDDKTLFAVLMRTHQGAWFIIMKWKKVISNIPEAKVIILISMKDHSVFLNLKWILSFYFSFLMFAKVLTLKKKSTMKVIFCFQMKGYSFVKENLLLLHLIWSVAGFKYFKQSARTIRILLNFTYDGSVSHSMNPYYVFLINLVLRICSVYMLLNLCRMQQ